MSRRKRLVGPERLQAEGEVRRKRFVPRVEEAGGRVLLERGPALKLSMEKIIFLSDHKITYVVKFSPRTIAGLE